MKTALMTKREKLGFASNNRVSHKPTDTGLASLWKATDVTSVGPLVYPLVRLNLELRGKAKDVKFAVERRTNASCWREALMRLGQYFIAREGSYHRLWYTLFWACWWIYLEGALSKFRRAKYAVKHLSTLAVFPHWLMTLATSSRGKCRRRSQTFRFFHVFLIHRISKFSMNFLLDVFSDLWFHPLSFCNTHDEKLKRSPQQFSLFHGLRLVASGMFQWAQPKFFAPQMGWKDAKFKSIQRRHVSKATN